MANDLLQFAADLNRLASNLTGQQMRSVMTELGVAAKKDAEDAVRRDIGDLSMSNWRRGRPIQIGARFDVTTATIVNVTPTPRSRGPFKVLEQGRQAGMSRGTRRRAARRVGRSRSQRTWTDAERIVEQRTPKRAMDAMTKLILRVVGGGR